MDREQVEEFNDVRQAVFDGLRGQKYLPASGPSEFPWRSLGRIGDATGCPSSYQSGSSSATPAWAGGGNYPTNGWNSNPF
jgi:hypothetical protein